MPDKSERCLPKKPSVDLAGANEILKLLKACESTVFEALQGKINLAEKIVELLHSFVRVPVTSELR
jgi:hypothetical protein